MPANRFEVLECQAALEAAEEGAQDTPPSRPGALDVLAQHVLGTACAGAVRSRSRSIARSRAPAPYQGLLREGFDHVVDFVATGGYALAHLRALRQAEADARRTAAASPIPASPSNTG